MASLIEPLESGLIWTVGDWFEEKKQPPSSVANLEGLREGGGEEDRRN